VTATAGGPVRRDLLRERRVGARAGQERTISLCATFSDDLTDGQTVTTLEGEQLTIGSPAAAST
jgi:hypothetical protein